MIAELYAESLLMAKFRLIKTPFGSLPTDYNPYLWKSLAEVTNATKFLLQ